MNTIIDYDFTIILKDDKRKIIQKDIDTITRDILQIIRKPLPSTSNATKLSDTSKLSRLLKKYKVTIVKKEKSYISSKKK